MMSATVLGLAITATSANVHAADTTDAADTTITSADGLTATTTNKASFTVDAGTLSFTQPADVTFDSTSVDSVYNTKYTSDKQGGSTTVTDFLGDKGAWTLTATAGGFGDDKLDSDSATTLTLNQHKLVKGTAVQVLAGAAGETPTALDYNLTIAQGTLLNKGTFTNTISWKLNNTPSTSSAQ